MARGIPEGSKMFKCSNCGTTFFAKADKTGRIRKIQCKKCGVNVSKDTAVRGKGLRKRSASVTEARQD